ncbi:MAG: succinylglutamate desuccinylase/aspartoacylase family protein [Lachnospiraceae bacterium]|nr:succinylglutamate desuccinylase/aspartoacylase family protein [Lachnospiraceae bacterium]
MIETIASVGLPVGEVLRIQKKRIWPEHTASKLKRISSVTGILEDQLVDGIFNLMKKMGIWTGEVKKPRKPIFSRDPQDVSYLNAHFSGIFLPQVKHWEELKKGDLIGKIVDPLKGTVLDEVTAHVDGKVFFIHNEPLTYANTAVIKLVQ